MSNRFSRIVLAACGLLVRGGLVWYRLRKGVARHYYRSQLKHCGENVRFDPLSSQIRYDEVELGDNVYIGPGAVLGRTRIGNDVMLGPNVHVRNGHHSFEIIGQTIQGTFDPADDGPPVVIEDDVWIGQDVTVLAAGHIGEGAVIGTRSIVSRRVPPYVVAAGVPCRVLRKRFSDDELLEHLRRRGRDIEEASAVVARRTLEMDAARS